MYMYVCVYVCVYIYIYIYDLRDSHGVAELGDLLLQGGAHLVERLLEHVLREYYHYYHYNCHYTYIYIYIYT